jgi:ERCC4-type nuclease
MNKGEYMTNITLLMPTDVIMDENEKATNPEIFEGLIKGKLSVAVKQLEAGDYLLLSKKGELPILVERKTAEDFVNSIIDGRIWKQSATLKKSKRGGSFTSHCFGRQSILYTRKKEDF